MESTTGVMFFLLTQTNALKNGGKSLKITIKYKFVLFDPPKMGNLRTVITLQSIQSSDSGFARRGPQPITKNPLIPGDFFHDLSLMSRVMLKKSFCKSLVSGHNLGFTKLKSSTLSSTELCRATRNYKVPWLITCFWFVLSFTRSL